MSTPAPLDPAQFLHRRHGHPVQNGEIFFVSKSVSGEYEILTMILLYLRQFSTRVYHTHVSALVHPLVHSLLYWSHLIQTWWQYLDKSIFDIASFFGSVQWWWLDFPVCQFFKCWLLHNAERNRRPCCPQQLGRGTNWSYFACLYFDHFYFCEEQQILGAMHGAHSELSWDLIAEREDFDFVCNSLLIFNCFNLWM